MKNILIVDDEARLRELYSRLLRAIGLNVYEASNATEATHFLITQKIDLILLDINIPELNGKEILEIINEYDPAMKIIVFSVYPVDEQQKIITRASAYYDKSKGPYVLLEKINNILFEIPQTSFSGFESQRSDLRLNEKAKLV